MATTPTKIILKHSFVSGALPDVSTLNAGEIAYNAPDRKLFWIDKDGDLVVTELDVNDSVATVLSTTYAQLMIKSITLDGGADLVITYEDDSVQNLGDVVGATGTGITILQTYDWGDEIPIVGDSPDLPSYMQITGTSVAVLYGAVTNDSPSWPVAHVFVYNAIDNDWTDIGPMIGPQGIQGIQGAAGPSSSQPYTIYFADDTTATITEAQIAVGQLDDWGIICTVSGGVMTGAAVGTGTDRFVGDPQTAYFLPVYIGGVRVSSGGLYQEDITCIDGESFAQLIKVG